MKSCVFSVLAAGALGLITSGECLALSPSALADWAHFREIYPYHIQALAVSQSHEGLRRTLIISEPPPNADMTGIRTIMAPARGVTVQKHPFGTDGWVKDVVVELPDESAENLRDRLERLSIYLFNTSYKAIAISLDQPHRATRPEFDLHVSSSDLNDFVFARNETFTRPGERSGASAAALLSGKGSGVFFSKKPGLVMWVVPRNGDVSNLTSDIRHFAMDSDLILGAVASPTQVGIVARERVVSLDLLPPLRTETILLLASAEKQELAQSYERNYIFAGRVKDGFDWAPIYLSRELIDTEYGSLMNVTDQLLKSWSESGLVRYVNFKYPSPLIRFPFDNGLAGQVGGDVTYNWNTHGFGYAVQSGHMETMAVNRTGALPVSYITGPSSLLRAKENKAYDFFSSTHDPNLARVVQYAELYQVFRHFGIHAHPPQPILAQTAVNDRAAERLVQLFRKVINTDVDLLAARLLSSNPGKTRYVLEGLAQLRQLQSSLRVIGGQGHAVGTDSGQLKFKNDGFRLAANSLLSGRESRNKSAFLDQNVQAVIRHANSQVFRQIVIVGSDREDMLTAFQAASGRPERGWVRTPSFVLSSGVAGIGGHNLGAGVNEFRANPALAQGKLRFVHETGRDIIEHSPRDVSAVSRLIPEIRMLVEENGSLERTALEERLKRIPPILSSVPRNQSLKLPATLSDSARSYQVSYATPSPIGEIGYQLSTTAIAPEMQRRISRLNEIAPAVVVEKDPAGAYFVSRKDSDLKIKVHGTSSLTELLTESPNSGNLNMHLKGFSEGEAQALKQNVMFHVQSKGDIKLEILGIMEKDGNITPASEQHLSATTYDFPHPTISEFESRVIDTPRGRGTEATYRLEFRSTIPERLPLIMRLKIFFLDSVVTPSMEVIRGAIDSALSIIARTRFHNPSMVNTHFSIRVFRSELRKVCPTGTKVRLEMDDMYIVQLEKELRVRTNNHEDS